MKKQEIAEIAWHLWNNVDQAPLDYEIKKLIESASVSVLKKFIETLLSEEGRLDWSADEEMVTKAKRLCGQELE